MLNVPIIAERVKAKCKERGSPIKLALENAGANRNFIYDVEKRQSCPSAEVLCNLADYLDCSVDYLLGRTDRPEVNK